MWKTEGACERQRERPQETGRGRDRQTDPPSGRLTGRETPTARRGEVEEGLTGTQTDSLTLKQTNRERQTYRKTQAETDWLTLIKLTGRETHTERGGGGGGGVDWQTDRLTDSHSQADQQGETDIQKDTGRGHRRQAETNRLTHSHQTNMERDTHRKKGGGGGVDWQTDRLTDSHSQADQQGETDIHRKKEGRRDWQTDRHSQAD